MNMNMFDDVCLCFSFVNESILNLLGRAGCYKQSSTAYVQLNDLLRHLELSSLWLD